MSDNAKEINTHMYYWKQLLDDADASYYILSCDIGVDKNALGQLRALSRRIEQIHCVLLYYSNSHTSKPSTLTIQPFVPGNFVAGPLVYSFNKKAAERLIAVAQMQAI